MSLENVESVSRWLGAISGGNRDFDRALALVHPDVVFIWPGDQASYRGAESLRRWMERDTLREQVVKAFAPVVITDTTILGSQLVSASGIELEVIVWSVWTFDEDGLITRIALYLDHEQDKAFEATRLALSLNLEEDEAFEAARLLE
jgi:ketosteroid isomerase-like protein